MNGITGADERSRTVDLLITNQLLYQLSYVGIASAARYTKPPRTRQPDAIDSELDFRHIFALNERRSVAISNLHRVPEKSS